VDEKMPIQSSTLKRRAEIFKTVGVAVLVMGFIAASVIYLSGEKNSANSPHDREAPELGDSWKDGSLSPEDLKGSSRTIEMNFGKVAVLILNWLHRCEELKPHQLLAIVIAMMAAVSATCCFFIAKRLLRERT